MGPVSGKAQVGREGWNRSFSTSLRHPGLNVNSMRSGLESGGFADVYSRNDGLLALTGLTIGVLIHIGCLTLLACFWIDGMH